jgi:uncharacterized BrkB/YihY/UPF0761 family membrane protein
MNSVAVGFVVAILTFSGGLIGLTLQKSLPEKYTTDHSSDTIKAVLALVTLLSALVLGLLIWTSYGVYTAQRTAVQTFATHVLQLDIALADLGPDAAPARTALKDEISRTHDEFWGHGNADFMARNYSASRANMQARKHFLAELHPANDAQKQALIAAQQETTTIWQTRLLMSFQLDNPVSWPLLTIVISWSLLLFCGYGLTSRMNAMTISTIAFGAIAVASAAYLIVDLSEPYTGLFRVSPIALERVIADLGQ